MESKRSVKISKYLSKHLRHAPEEIGLQLESGGWVAVDALLDACRRNNFAVSRAELEEVVASSDKQRFAFDETGTRIRANQGHSVAVDLELAPATPPATLYHGTGAQNEVAIRQSGLLKMQRHHVHLSGDMDTAVKVGSRHGKPIVFVIDAVRMQQDGFTFFVSANGVWLVESVPPDYLSRT
jgi:putative RNA 2'-phosphotransferase